MSLTFGTYSAKMIMGQPKKPVALSVQCFQLKYVGLKLRKISGVGGVDYSFEEIK